MAGASENQFSPWDYVVFAVFLIFSASIGIFFGCIKSRQKTTKEYFMANREMTVLPVSLSLLASFMSAITLLGTPAEIYVYGTQYWMIWIGYCMVIPMAAHVFLPVLYRLKVTSVFEYLELRFHSRGIRVFAAVVYIIQMILYMAIVLYAPSLALSAVTGLNVWISVFSVGIVCTFYTSLGGMKAVMWTDVFQIMMMFVGLSAVLIKGSIDFGGFANIWRINDEGGRVEFLNWDPNPMVRHTFWSLSFGGAFTWLSVYGVNQAQMQRAMCTPTLRQGQIALWINLPGLTALLTVCSLCGMVVYAQYKDCDPLSTNKIQAKDQLLPLYVMDALAIPGIPGIFTACLFSGALSTISSGLNSLSAVTLKDMVQFLCFKDLTDSKATLITKLLSGCYGVLMIALTFVAANLGGVLQAALALFGMLGGPILGLFMLGMLFPCANKKGAYAGFIVSLLLTIWLGIGANVYKPYVPKLPVSTQCLLVNSTLNTNMTDSPFTYSDMTTADMYTTASTTTIDPYDKQAQQTGYLRFYETSYLWYSGFAVTIMLVVGLVVSLVTGIDDAESIDPKLICPFFDTFFCCLPKSLRQKLWCGVQHDAEKYEDGDKEKDAEIQNGRIVEENEKVTNGYSNTVSNGTSYELPSTKL